MNELESLYQQLILDHSRRPIGKAPIDAPEGAIVASQHEYNPSCGDELTMTVAADPESGKITHLGWEGQGCSISMASASILAQLFRDADGFTLAEARERIDAFRDMIHSRGKGDEPDEDLLGDAVALQGVSKFVMRVKCAMLGWVALESDAAQVEAQLTTRSEGATQ